MDDELMMSFVETVATIQDALVSSTKAFLACVNKRSGVE